MKFLVIACIVAVCNANPYQGNTNIISHLKCNAIFLIKIKLTELPLPMLN